MMGIDEFLEFENELTALVKKCGIDNYLKMRDERIAYLICQYLLALWGIVHDRDEWNTFLGRMEDLKPAEVTGSTQENTSIEQKGKREPDPFTADEPLPVSGGIKDQKPTEIDNFMQENTKIAPEWKSEPDPFTDNESFSANEFSFDEKASTFFSDEIVDKLPDENNLFSAPTPVTPEPFIDSQDLQPGFTITHEPSVQDERPAQTEQADNEPDQKYLDLEKKYAHLMGVVESLMATKNAPARDSSAQEAGETAVPIIHFGDQPASEGTYVPTINFNEPVIKDDPVPLMNSFDPAPADNAFAAGFQEPAIPVEPKPATGFALKMDSDAPGAPKAPPEPEVFDLHENCQIIGRPEAGFHITCFKCSRQKDCQNSHEKKRARR